MFNKYAIKNVTIGSFVDNKTGEHVTIGNNGKKQNFESIELNVNSMEDILAVIDEKNNNAIDIFSGEVYHIVKRDEGNRIIETPGFIQPDVFYALKVHTNDKYTDSQLFRMYCISMANKVVIDYQQKHEDVSFQKVKKK